MNKALKRTLVIAAVLIALAAAAFGVMSVIKALNRKPVKVYSFSEICIEDFSGTSSESYGEVKADNIQSVRLSDTQSLVELYVSEGDSVKAGDPILKYDTSLSELDVKKAGIALEKMKLKLSESESFLRSLDTALISENIEGAIAELENKLEAEEERIAAIRPVYPKLPLGSFTEDDPGYVRAEDDIGIEEIVSDIANGEEKYVVFVDEEDGEYVGYRGIRFSRDGAGKVTFGFFDAAPLEGEYPEFEDNRDAIREQIDNMYALMEKSYSAAELVALKAETASEIKDLGVRIKVAEVDYKKKSEEAEDGVVYSKIDGVVKSAAVDGGNAETAAVVISAGGGYYIDCGIGEFFIGCVNVGDTVTVSSWNTGVVCDGEIVSVDTSKTAEGDYYTDGNQNSSTYLMRVFVSEDVELEENDYVSVSFNAGESAGYKCIPNMFLRYDNGKAYVFASSGDGTLEKRYIVTGKDYYGEYTQVKEGLDTSDRIAFPYGKDVSVGAKTVEASADDLYGGDYYVY